MRVHRSIKAIQIVKRVSNVRGNALRMPKISYQ